MTILQSFRDQLQKYEEVVENKASDELSKLRGKADKKLRDTNRRLDDLKKDAEEFRENISDESNVMDKYSQRIYESITQTIDSIYQPERITLRDLNRFAETTRKALSDQDTVLIKYVKLLKDKKYKSRVKTLDRSLKRLNKDLQNLEKFIKQDYTPNASIEQAPALIEETIELLEDYSNRYHVLMEREEQVLAFDEEISKLEKEVDGIKHHPIRSRHQELIHEYEQNQRDIDHAFANIRKVFRKYDKRVLNGYDIDSNLISNLVTDAASTLAEMKSIATVRNLLEQMYEILDNTALNLSKDKRENAKTDIKKFLDGELERLNDKATSTIKEKEEVEMKIAELDLDAKLDHAETQLAATKRDRNRAYERQLRSLRNVEENIKKNILELNTELNRVLRDNVDLPTDLKELPSWVELRE